MQKGKIDVSTENIFPVIKKFLYSQHDIFLRELISNAIDATQKLKTLSTVGDFKGEIGDEKVRVSIDKKKKTITISDHGLGMTEEEIDKYINQIAFSSAEDFLEKYKDQSNAIIGHFGLGFYSSYMVSEKVEIITKSHKAKSKAIKWSCDGSPEYTIEDTEKKERGTDIVLYIDNDSEEFLEEARIDELLQKYCKFLPVEIVFGKVTDWKDGKELKTDKDKIINNPNPAWMKKPVDLKEEDYQKFYKELYPAVFEDPLFHIHLNVDYPFNLTGILYFPRIKNNVEVQKNKIQLYCNQVFVTDSVEDIVPEFLTLLHGVIDSPDIPLNVSRSFLQGDPNIKKIASHIIKKVADRLEEIFKDERSEFEKKWDDLSLFITYGMLSEEKFYDRAEKFAMFKNTDGKYFTFEEYKALITENQTDKDKSLVYLYTTNQEEQFSYIEAAQSKGYDVLLLDGHLDAHLVNHLEQKFGSTKFVRVDADVVDKLILKEDKTEIKLSEKDRFELVSVFQSQIPQGKENFIIAVEGMAETSNPVMITQTEFMRRMKDMSQMGGGGMSFYGDMPDSYNLVINANHSLIGKINEEKNKKTDKKIEDIEEKLSPVKTDIEKLNKAKEGKKEEEIKQAEKDKLTDLTKKETELNDKKNVILSEYGKKNKLIKQLIDLALISNNMLKGEALNQFVKRSIDIIK